MEKKLKNNDFIVSKTDTKGVITYCNKIFLNMAEYSEEDLLGKPHNLIRHPDMPKVAFKFAWDFIKSGQEFFGFVKNLTKSGKFYWVFTNISPDYDENKNIIGFTSVRRQANTEAIKTIEPIYKKLIEIEKMQGIEGSKKFLLDFLEENNTSYIELVIALQGEN